MNIKALYLISYGLYLVGARERDKLNAQVVNTVIQVCSEPVKLAVAINRDNFTHDLITASKGFTATVLAKETPLSFIGSFGFRSGKHVDKFEGVNFKLSSNQLPIVLDNALAYLEVKLVNEIGVGTHTLFIGDLIEADIIRNGEPMTYSYYLQVKRGTTPRSAPSYVEIKKEEAPKMEKYRCTVCNYIYDPELGDPDGGIKPGTPFEIIPDSWTCPVCGASKDQFEKV